MNRNQKFQKIINDKKPLKQNHSKNNQKSMSKHEKTHIKNYKEKFSICKHELEITESENKYSRRKLAMLTHQVQIAEMMKQNSEKKADRLSSIIKKISKDLKIIVQNVECRNSSAALLEISKNLKEFEEKREIEDPSISLQVTKTHYTA